MSSIGCLPWWIGFMRSAIDAAVKRL